MNTKQNIATQNKTANGRFLSVINGAAEFAKGFKNTLCGQENLSNVKHREISDDEAIAIANSLSPEQQRRAYEYAPLSDVRKTLSLAGQRTDQERKKSENTTVTKMETVIETKETEAPRSRGQGLYGRNARRAKRKQHIETNGLL